MKNTHLRMTGKKVYSVLNIIQGASITLLALTSMFVLNQMIGAFFLQFLYSYPVLAATFTVACVALILVVVDFGLKIILPYVFIELLGKNWKKPERRNVRIFVIMLGIFAIFQMAFTTSLTYLGADDIVNISIEKPTGGNYNKNAQLRANQFTTALSRYDEDVNTLRRNESLRVRNAKQDAKNLLTAALNSKGEEMARLYKKENKWAASQLKRAIQKATAEGNALIISERNAVKDATEGRQAFISEHTKNDKTLLSPIQQMEQTEATEYTERKQGRKTLFRYAAFVFLGIFVVTTFLIAIYKNDVEEEPHGDQEYISISAIFAKWWERVRRNWASRLDSNLNKFVPAPAIASPTPVPTPKRRKAASPLPDSKSAPKPIPRKEPETDPIPDSNLTDPNERPIQIEERGGVFYYIHPQSSGKPIPMRLTQVSQKVRKYRASLKEAERGLTDDPGNQSKTLVVQNRANWLTFWENVRVELKSEKL